jgi:hypothetical protein
MLPPLDQANPIGPLSISKTAYPYKALSGGRQGYLLSLRLEWLSIDNAMKVDPRAFRIASP